MPDGEGQYFGIRLIDLFTDLDGMGVNDRPTPDHQKIDESKVVPVRDAEDIKVTKPWVDHGRTNSIVMFQMFDLSTQDLGLFEGQGLGVFFHLRLIMLQDGREVTLQDAAQPLQPFLIVGLRLQAYAGPLAIPQMVFEADLIFSFRDLFF